jgi:hypothetical protein
MICLGVAFEYSNLGGQPGDCFAVKHCGSEEAYLQQVLRLQWMGQL